MTAEIAVLNHMGVALAADSAVTVQMGEGQKIFPSANKLFALSKYEPVGIMVFGDADFMGMPWETIVKVFREHLSSERHPNLEQYTRRFLHYLEDNRLCSPENQQTRYVTNELRATFDAIRKKANDETYQSMTGGSSRPTEEVRLESLRLIIRENLTRLESTPWWEDIEGTALSEDSLRSIAGGYAPLINTTVSDFFDSWEIVDDDRSSLVQMGYLILMKAVGITGYSGIVVAGFGADDMFPSLTCHHVFGVLGNRLKLQCQPSKQAKIDYVNGAAIVPFAQSEMVHTFIEGVDPTYQGTVVSTVTDLLSEYLSAARALIPGFPEAAMDALERTIPRVIEAFVDRLHQTRSESFVDPILQVVLSLPKPELASMAESLVNLTSLKRRMSASTETVGGPIDVALISRGDGLVWIHRKHYFERDLNWHFFQNYYRRGTNDEQSRHD